MNRTIIATTAIVAIAPVAIFGLHSLTQATTTVDPVTPDDADVNWDGRINSIDQLWLAKKYGQAVDPSGRPVREQNLDANGNIKVAQQGSLDVRVVESQEPTLIPIATDAFVPRGAINEADYVPVGPFIDVRSCTKIDVFLNATVLNSDLASGQGPQGWISTVLEFSLDGNTSYGLGNPAAQFGGGVLSTSDEDGTTQNLIASPDWYVGGSNPASPYVRLNVAVLSTTAGGADASVTASLYCSRR